MWYLGTWPSVGLGSVTNTVGLSDLLQPKQFCDSIILVLILSVHFEQRALSNTLLHKDLAPQC